MEWFDIDEKKPEPLSLVRAYDGNIAVTMGVNKDGLFVPFPGLPHTNGIITHWAYEPHSDLKLGVITYIHNGGNIV